MDPLPAPQKLFRRDRSARKRRRSGGEQEGSESEYWAFFVTVLIKTCHLKPINREQVLKVLYKLYLPCPFLNCKQS